MLDESSLRAGMRAVEADLMRVAPMLPRLGDLMLRSIGKTFDAGGRSGSENEYGGGNQKWAQSEAARERGGKTLVGKGNLRRSFKFRIEGNDIVIYSDLDYAAALFGDGGEGGLGMPPRRLSALQKSDLRDAEKLVIDHYSKAIGR